MPHPERNKTLRIAHRGKPQRVTVESTGRTTGDHGAGCVRFHGRSTRRQVTVHRDRSGYWRRSTRTNPNTPRQQITAAMPGAIERRKGP